MGLIKQLIMLGNLSVVDVMEMGVKELIVGLVMVRGLLSKELVLDYLYR